MSSAAHNPPDDVVATVSEFKEDWDAIAARTQQFCADQPPQQEIRTTLLRAEKQIHQNGWDAPPEMFFLQQNTKTMRVRYTKLDTLSHLLVTLPGRSPDALQMIAEFTERLRAQAMASSASPLAETVPPALRHLAFARPDQDLFKGVGPNWRFHGIGFAHEAWLRLRATPEDMELIKQHRLYTHPERIEIRQIYYTGRDGWNWQVLRLRRTPTKIVVPRYCVVLNNDNAPQIAGTVPHYLSRLCNAIVSNPVPITPDHIPDVEPEQT